MKHKNITWIAFLATLSTLSISTETVAHNSNEPSQDNNQQTIEKRLSRISESLKAREKELADDSEVKIDEQNPLLARGWLKGRRGSFVDGRGGGFINRRRWYDRGGFYNRRYRY